MRSIERSRLLVLILIISAIPRLVAIHFGLSFHPDERHIVFTVMKMTLSDLNPHFFGYGGLPFHLLAFLGFCASAQGLFVLAHMIAAAVGIATVYFTYLLGEEFGVGLLSAALLGTNVFHIQLSHFYVVDIFLTAFTVLALLMLLRGHFGRAALFVGLGLATKISALYLLIPYAIAALAQKNMLRAAKLSPLILLVFLAFSPYTLLDWSHFIAGTKEHLALASGSYIPPFAIQYIDTPAYLYPLRQMFGYTLTPLLYLVVIFAFIAVGLKQLTKPDKKELVLVCFVLPVFLVVGAMQVKFPRYLLPIYPVLFVITAIWLSRIHKAFTVATLTYAFLVMLAYISIFMKPHVYDTASAWIDENIPEGSMVLGTHWDDILPAIMSGKYKWGEMQVYNLPDDEAKVVTIGNQIDVADYIILPTNRLYESIKHAPYNYPHMNHMFQLLFSGKFGYELAARFKTNPELFGFEYDDTKADESLTVYDHPEVLIFRHVR